MIDFPHLSRHFELTTSLKVRQQSQRSCPFVCQKMPFVGVRSPFILPFICCNEPSVVFNKNNTGFTLIELIITLVIAAILLGFGVPVMTDMVREQRLRSTTNEFLSDISYARSESIRRRTQIGVCAGNNTGCVVGAQWRDGRIIFVDTNANNNHDAGEEILRLREALERNITLNNISSAGPAIMVFSAAGGAALGANTNYMLCDTRGVTSGRRVEVSASGRARSDAPQVGDGCA